MPDPTDWQYEFNGLLIGPGTSYAVESVEGLGELEIRAEVLDRVEDHGSFAFAKYVDSRTVQLRGLIVNASATDIRTLVNDLKTAFLPQDEPVAFRWKEANDGIKRVYCKPMRRRLPFGDALYRAGVAEFVIQMVAEDPRIYSDGATMQTIDGTALGGIGFDTAFNIDFGGGGSGTGNAENAGIFPVYPTARIQGPAGPLISLQNLTTGKRLVLNGSLASTEYLDIDFANRTVLLNGETNRYNLVDQTQSEWWPLEAGLNSVQFFSTDGGTASLSWRDAWI